MWQVLLRYIWRIVGVRGPPPCQARAQRLPPVLPAGAGLEATPPCHTHVPDAAAGRHTARKEVGGCGWARSGQLTAPHPCAATRMHRGRRNDRPHATGWLSGPFPPAVQLNHALAACLLVKAVHILGDEREAPPLLPQPPLERRNGIVRPVGLARRRHVPAPAVKLPHQAGVAHKGLRGGCGGKDGGQLRLVRMTHSKQTPLSPSRSRSPAAHQAPWVRSCATSPGLLERWGCRSPHSRPRLREEQGGGRCFPELHGAGLDTRFRRS